jgi:hypothetical protein
MNRHGKLQEIYDEAILTTLASSDDFYIIKEAGLWDELGFDSIASSIKGLIQKHVVKENSASGYLDALGEVLISGSLFKIHPVLGIAYAVAKAMGVDVGGIVSGVFDAVKGALSGGGTLSEADFDSITKSAKYEADLTKLGQKVNVPFMPRKGAGLIARVFGNLFSRGMKTKALWLAKGIIIWALKTALLGAGLLTATGAATSLIKGLVAGDGKEHAHKATTPTPEESAGSGYVAPTPSASKRTPVPRSKLRPSGAGEKRFKNDVDNMWIVPLVNRNVPDTLLAWTEEIYPQLSGYDSIVSRSPAFQGAVATLRQNKSTTNPNSLLMPPGMTSRKQVVDLFAHQAAKGLI